jgi:hypothetical protein
MKRSVAFCWTYHLIPPFGDESSNSVEGSKRNRRSLSLTILVPVVAKYLEGDAVQGVVNTDEKQKQRRGSNTKEGAARLEGNYLLK